jgi:sugar transferase (PEP-CTERM/EpsH1 system associated)
MTLSTGPTASASTRVLSITHRFPFPPDKGDRIRNYHVLRELAGAARVWLVALADEPVAADHLAVVRDLCERVEVVPVGGRSRWLRAGLSMLGGRSLSEGLFHEPALDTLLNRWTAETEFAASVVSASSLTPYQRRPGLRSIPAFVDLVDVDSQKWFDFAAASRPPKRWVYQLESRRVRRLEREIAGWASGVMIVSRAEADVYDSFTTSGTATVATNGVDLSYFSPQPGVLTKPACAFVGAMDYFPNVDAAVWFATEVWPWVRERHPAAEFRVVGRQPTAEVRKLAEQPGVVVTGGVPDVRRYVADAALAVCPIRVARGLQNKVLEAMALGKATVAAPAAVAALQTVNGRDLVSPRTADEWVTTVCDLLNDTDRRTELGRAARKYVEDHHCWHRCLQPFVEKMNLLPSPLGERSQA